MFVASSTTQMMALFRDALAQKMHGSASVILLQIEHSRTFSLASRIASDNANAWSLSTRNKKNARRCAVFWPMPGNLFNSSINRVTEGAKSGMHHFLLRGFQKRRESLSHFRTGPLKLAQNIPGIFNPACRR